MKNIKPFGPTIGKTKISKRFFEKLNEELDGFKKAIEEKGEEFIREKYGNLLTQRFKNNDVDVILLIGFMRILSKSFCDDWNNKILNVHPSLLPKYAGGINNNVHKEVLKNNDNETGCTIHYVTADVDSGPVLVQKKCKVQPNDTVESLKHRVQLLEGQAFIEALHLIEKKNYA